MTFPSQVCVLVREHFIKFGVTPAEIAAMSESPLVTAMEEVARIYRAGDMVALWDVARGTLKFYDCRAELLLTCSDTELPSASSVPQPHFDQGAKTRPQGTSESP